MKAVFSERNLLIVGCALLGLIFLSQKKDKEERLEKPVVAVAAPMPAPPSSKQTVVRKSASVAASTPSAQPSAQAPTANSPAVAPASNNTDTLDLCREFSSHKFLVHKTLLRPLITQGGGAIAVPDDLQKCIQEKTNVLVLQFAGFDYKNPNPYYYSTIEPRAFVSAIEKNLDLKKVLLDSAKLHKLGFQTEASASKFYASIFGPESTKKKWSYITFSISDKNLQAVTFFAPQAHPLAKVAKKENVNALISSGAMVVDVRPANHFKVSHIEKAVSNPTALKTLAKAALSVEEQKKAGYVIHPTMLPKEKSSAIIVVNQNPKSYSAYNTLTQLSNMGYTNLHFYWAGMDDWEGKSIITPPEVEGLRFISYNDLNGRFNSQDALVVDVRSAKSAKSKILPRNVHMPFSEKKNAFKDPLYRVEGLNAAAIQKNDERFLVGMPELPSNIRTLVMIGDHTYDWKPLKAGLVIPHNSGIRIEVYRDGYKGWKYLSNLESPLPKRIGSSKKDLAKAGNSTPGSLGSGANPAKANAANKSAATQNNKAKEDKKSKKKAPKKVRMTRSNGTTYPKLNNAPPPAKAK